MIIRSLFLSSLLAFRVFADESAPAQVNKDLVMAKTLEWMCDIDPERRAIAFRSLQAFDEIDSRDFQILLEKARQHHEKKLTDILIDSIGPLSPYKDFAPVYEELKGERETLFPLIHTDYQKDSCKIRMLQEGMDKINRLHDRVLKTCKTDPTTYDETIRTFASALADVYAEIERIERKDPDIEPDSARHMIGEMAGGENYLNVREARLNFLEMKDRLDFISKEHAKLQWANSAQVAFADHLNHERVALGLIPLALDEKLSDAAVGHSEDMIRFGFFAHLSPVKGKRSPGDRAKLAGFQYLWSGENIFMGSASHVAAYNAWFASDGHRFIMMAKDPNSLGIGPVGSHWTLMTGRK